MSVESGKRNDGINLNNVKMQTAYRRIFRFQRRQKPKTKSRKERGMHETSDLNLSFIFINMFQRIYGKKYNMTRELANYFSNSNLNTVWFLIGSQISHISDAFEMCLSLTTVTRRVMGEVWNGFILLNKSYQFRHVTHFHTHPKDPPCTATTMCFQYQNEDSPKNTVVWKLH